jgi:hypothetical protein
MVLVDTGAAIEAWATPFDGCMAVPITNGAILKAYRAYVWNGTLSQWEDQANPVHDHSDDSEGGSYSNIRMGAARTFWGIQENDLSFTTGTNGTYANTLSGSDGYRNINSGATSGNSGNLIHAGLRYDMAFALYAQFRAQMTTATTNYTTRAGFNMEYAAVAANASKKLGLEACNTCNGVNNRVVSADGTTRSASNTTDAADATAIYKLVFNPNTPSLTYTKDNGTAVVKTSNMPTTGVPDRSNVFVVGISTGTGTARDLKLWGLRAFGTMSSESGAWS